MAAYRRSVIDRPGIAAVPATGTGAAWTLSHRVYLDADFDFSTGCFVLDDVTIGRGTREQDVEGRIAGQFSDVPGQPGYRNFDGRSGDLNIALGFRDRLLESGCFFVALPRPGQWEQLEENEAWRRTQHEAIMQSLFRAMRYETRDLIVDLIREPRNRTGQLRFAVPR